MPDLRVLPVGFFLALVAAWLIALAAYPLVRRSGPLAKLSLAIVVSGLVSCPLLIPPQNTGLRAIAGFLSGDLLMRVIDFARQARRKRQQPAARSSSPFANWSEYIRFLLPLPVLMVVFGQRPPWKFNRAAWQWEPLRVLAGIAVCAGAVWTLVALRRTTVLQSSLWLDQLTVVVCYVPAIESLGQCLLGVERLAGFATQPLIRNAFLARTPAEYWLRYNVRVQRWLGLNVFLPCGGGRRPVWGTVLVFVASALLHEVLFDIATSEITGYQAAFFLLQIPAVLASRRLEMFAREHGVVGDVVARAVTFAWFVVTSVLFFYGVARIFPFIYAGREGWLN